MSFRLYFGFLKRKILFSERTYGSAIAADITYFVENGILLHFAVFADVSLSVRKSARKRSERDIKALAAHFDI